MRIVTAIFSGFLAGLVAAVIGVYGGLRPEALPYLAPHLTQPASATKKIKALEKRQNGLEKKLEAQSRQGADKNPRAKTTSREWRAATRQLQTQIRTQALLSLLNRAESALNRNDQGEGKRFLSLAQKQALELEAHLPEDVALVLKNLDTKNPQEDALLLDRLRFAARVLEQHLLDHKATAPATP